jgi:hypothetical protein
MPANAFEALFYFFRNQSEQIFIYPIGAVKMFFTIARTAAKPFMVSASQPNANEALPLRLLLATDKASLAQLPALCRAVMDSVRQWLCYDLRLGQATSALVNAHQPPPKV